MFVNYVKLDTFYKMIKHVNKLLMFQIVNLIKLIKINVYNVNKILDLINKKLFVINKSKNVKIIMILQQQMIKQFVQHVKMVIIQLILVKIVNKEMLNIVGNINKIW